MAIQVKILKSGVQTHSGNFENTFLANQWIVKQENKAMCPWGRPGIRTGFKPDIPAVTEKWYKLSSFAKLTDAIIKLQGDYTVTAVDIVESKEVVEMGRTYIYVNCKAAYTIEVIDTDQSADAITAKKKEMIVKVRAMTIEILNEEYDNEQIDMITIKAVKALGNANPLPAAFTTMFDFIKTVNDNKQTCINAIKACTTMNQLRDIVYNGVSIF